MGRDLNLINLKATKKDLKLYLEDLGFKRCEHLWDWPKGSISYYWFDNTDYKSITGVEATIYPSEIEEDNKIKVQWCLHLRNTYSASIYDVKMLNDVLRKARKLFEGTIDGDYGKNRYAPLWEDNSTPISRGVTSVYNKINQELEAIKFALPNSTVKQVETTNDKFDQYIEFINSHDPSRVLYNGLVPFVVSMFEHFFSSIFQILIKYDEFALNKKMNHKTKVDFSVLIDFEKGERTLENIIASNYTFQNLNHINKAYKEWLNIDIRKILYKKKKIGKQITFLEKRISQIIEHRHGVIHHFNIDRTLTRKDYLDILEVIEKIMIEIIKFIELKYNTKILD